MGKIRRGVSDALLEPVSNKISATAHVIEVYVNTFFKRQKLSQVSFYNNNLLTLPTLPNIFSSFHFGALGLVNHLNFSFLCIVSLPESTLNTSKGSD